jgi:hypothetical protein
LIELLLEQLNSLDEMDEWLFIYHKQKKRRPRRKPLRTIERRQSNDEKNWWRQLQNFLQLIRLGIKNQKILDHTSK